ncbi:hypothetical protein [Pedobacter helvus]|uniref:Lipoprotein n=1 Tax=Pedobacter helvus TaxID=2563444 RepID=A0ABW9JHD2_9SPHI|nr:hypothetical protein [Pedobacter ureilyticus]
MKKLILFLIVQLAIGCAAKHKLTSRAEEKAERKITTATGAEMRDSSIVLHQQLDSLWHQQTFRLYPKGVISLGSNGFIGEVDSVLWLTKELHLQRNNLVQQKQMREEVNQYMTSTNNSQAKEIINEKNKIDFSFGLVLAIVMLLVGVFWWRRGKQ